MNKIVLLTSFMLLSSVSYAGLYRWVDDTGKVHYSDKVPVAASKKIHSELSETGTVKKTFDPQADKEVATEEKKKKDLLILEELKRQEDLIKNADEIKRKARVDRYLLATYEDENELTRFFKNKIKLIEGNNNILRTQSTVLAKKITILKSRQNRVKSQKVADQIARKIVRIERSVDRYRKAMKENNEELVAVNKQFEHDYQRFTELTKKK